MADLITHLSTTDLSVPRPSVASVSEVTCGFTCWRPRFLRRYANPKIFVAIFSLIATMRSAYFVYMIGVMSTLEKRYAFPSKLSALILIADNISGMVMSPVIGYLGTKFHGPKIIGWGTVLVGLSSIVSGLPYLIYGPATHLLSAETLGIKSSSSLNSTTKYDLCSLSGKPETCQDADRHTFVVGAYALLWAGSFVNGLGNTAFWVVGVPYLDDNVEKKNSPVYFSKFTIKSFLHRNCQLSELNLALHLKSRPYVVCVIRPKHSFVFSLTIDSIKLQLWVKWLILINAIILFSPVLLN